MIYEVYHKNDKTHRDRERERCKIYIYNNIYIYIITATYSIYTLQIHIQKNHYTYIVR
jgi:hypothetical protein